MIQNYSDDKLNTKTFVFTVCDKCGNPQRRLYKKYLKIKENSAWDMDYCEPCWASIRQKTPESKLIMSMSINKMIEEDPDWKVRNSESKKGKINLGDSNGMKSDESRKKLSSTRKKLMDIGLRKQISEQMKKAWSEGKFEGVKVGRSQWYHYKHSNGETYKVQGRYEFHFIEWLDLNGLEFECHKKRIPYTDSNGDKHTYFPDFFVNDWNCYVEIKNKFHMSQQIEKFERIKICNPSIELKILLEEDLKKLGIKI